MKILNLTIDDLPEVFRSVPTSKLSLFDFSPSTNSMSAIDRLMSDEADLDHDFRTRVHAADKIVYTAPDGTERVFKDRSGNIS